MSAARRGRLLVMLALIALAGTGCPRQSNPAQTQWGALWPQESRAEAEHAQEAATRGDDRYSWQLAPDGELVALRYAREELGWKSFQGFDARARHDTRRLRLIQCASGANADYPEEACAPGRDRTYPAAFITVAQLLKRGPNGLWFVTDVRLSELRQVEPGTRRQARHAVARLLERRIEGANAEAFLSPEGRADFGRANPLYSPDEGSPYAGYKIVFVGGPFWPFGSFEVGVRMILSSGAGLEDTLFVGPGRNVHGYKKRIVVQGLRPGLDGP